MGTFHYDNPFMAILVRIANLMLLSFYWVLCCLPIVTIVPASAALYHSVCKVVRGNGNGVTRDFFRTLRQELKTGTVLSLFCGAAGAMLAYGLFLGGQLWQDNVFGFIHFAVGALLVLVLVPTVLYIPPTLSRFQGSTSVMLRLSLYFSSQHPLRNLFMLLLLALIIFLVDFYPILLLLLPGIYVDLICTGMEKTLQKYAEENGLLDAEEDEGLPKAGEVQEMSAIALDRYLTGKEEEI